MEQNAFNSLSTGMDLIALTVGMSPPIPSRHGASAKPTRRRQLPRFEHLHNAFGLGALVGIARPAHAALEASLVEARRGEAVVWGSTDHALLIYGGDCDRDGKPLSYLIKDSLAPYTYRASAEKMHRIVHDVTVALPDSAIETTSRSGDGAVCLAGGCEGKPSGSPNATGAP